MIIQMNQKVKKDITIKKIFINSEVPRAEPLYYNCMQALVVILQNYFGVEVVYRKHYKYVVFSPLYSANLCNILKLPTKVWITKSRI